MATRRAVKASSSRSIRTTSKAARARRSPAAARGRARRIVAAPEVEPVEVEAEERDGEVAGAAGASAEATQNNRFTAALDRRIIEGMLHDREGLMVEMSSRGITASMVVRRAAELGLSEALIRQVKGVAADLAGERPGRKSPPPSLGARTCLCCDRVFLSTGPGNRLCMRCRGGDAGLAQL